MATILMDTPQEGGIPAADKSTRNQRYIWLAIGAAISMLATGGPLDIPLAAWFAPVFLLRFCRNSSPLVGFGAVLLVAYAAAMFYLYQMAIIFPTTTAGTLLFATIFTLPYLLDRLLAPRLGAVGSILLFPATLAAWELIAALYTPFGGGYLRAISQSGNLPLLQIVSVTGPYSIAFLIGWFATTANLVWDSPSWDKSGKFIIAFAAAILAVLAIGAARISFFPPKADYVKIAGISPGMGVIDKAKNMVEGGFPEDKDALAKADPVKLQIAYNLINDELLASTYEAAKAGAKIIMWSETAAWAFPEGKAALLARAKDIARQEHVYINVASGQPFALNETHLIDPEGNILWSYQKNHPVPGLEPVPAGTVPPPVVQTPYGRLTNVICFDADFPGFTQIDADIMMVPGLDWPEIGKTHTMKMASLRAIENGYSLIRQDFDGQSAAFDYHGHVLATQDTTLAPDTHVMIVDMPTKGSRTIYNRIGDVFGWLCVLATLFIVVLAMRSKQKAG